LIVSNATIEILFLLVLVLILEQSRMDTDC
jgi:hypothetical protein